MDSGKECLVPMLFMLPIIFIVSLLAPFVIVLCGNSATWARSRIVALVIIGKLHTHLICWLSSTAYYGFWVSMFSDLAASQQAKAFTAADGNAFTAIADKTFICVCSLWRRSDTREVVARQLKARGKYKGANCLTVSAYLQRALCLSKKHSPFREEGASTGFRRETAKLNFTALTYNSD